jgi:hypothetical protein
MLRLLRQCRALAVTLLLAAPGLGGTWLSLAHPCPVDMPWLAAGEHADHGAQSSHGHDDAPGSSSSSCSCVGACHGASAALTARAVEAAITLARQGWDTAPSSPDSDAPDQHSPHRHPTATAPPLA